MVSTKDVGLLVRACRKNRDITQAELAAKCGVGRHWIVGLEKGKATVQLKLVLRVFHVLDLPFPSFPDDSQTLIAHMLDLLEQGEEGRTIWSISDLHLRLSMRLEKYLREIPMAPLTENDKKEVIHDEVAARTAQAGVALSNALLEYVSSHGGILDKYLEHAEEWPVTMSVYSYKDIRCVSRDVSDGAAKLYKPLTSVFGRKRTAEARYKEPTYFRKLANMFAERVVVMMESASVCRRLGLPWVLDYMDDRGNLRMLGDNKKGGDDRPLHVIPTQGMNKKERRQWFAAMRYLIYLVLAPRKTRDRLRKSWRDFRVQMFNRHRASRSASMGNSTSFKEGKLMEVQSNWTLPDEIIINAEMLAGDIKSWEECYLTCDPTKIFGNYHSLFAGRKPVEVKNIMKQYPNVDVAFERCVLQILMNYPFKGRGKYEERVGNKWKEVRQMSCGKLPSSKDRNLSSELIFKVAQKLKNAAS